VATGGGVRTGWERLNGIVPGLALVTVLVVLAFAAGEAVDLSPLVVGIVLGAVASNLTRGSLGELAALRPGFAFAGRSLLRWGVVLLGLRLSLGDLADLGAKGLLVVALVVTSTFFGTRWLARRLGIAPALGLLVATGYSICGASAIAAVNGVVRADEEETAYAITLVTICGTLSIFVLPAIAGLVDLDGAAFGTWVGGAVHDVGQVVATASHDGDAALEAATVVKLTRVVLLAPLVAAVAMAERRSGAVTGAAEGTRPHPPVVPAFVVAFLAAVVIRSSGVLPDDVLSFAADVEKVLLTAALAAMGLGVRVDRMRRIGARPLVLGLLAWVLVAGAAYGATLVVT
jgi:uncharacterized integral membrane protein (TIGR00698 family)